MATAVHVLQSSAASSSTSLQAASTTAPVLEFVCLFTHDLRRKQKRWQDGRLKYHTFNRRVMVYDERGNFVGDTHWREDFPLSDGEELQLERGGTIVQVAECVGSRDQDLSELVDKRAQEKAQRQSAALARRHPTLEPPTPQPAAVVAPHFQLRHQPLHRLIGTPTGHHGRAAIPSESPYEQRRQQSEASPTHDDDNRPAKRRKRDISPPSKSGYAQSLFGTTLTLSGRPMSSAPIRHRPANMARARQADPCPTSSDQSNRDNDIETVPPAPRTAVASEKPRNVSVGSRFFGNDIRKLPASPSRRSVEPQRASSILIDDTPEQQQLSDTAQNHTSRSPRLTKDNRVSDRKQRTPLQSVPVNQNQTLGDYASRASNGDASKHRLLDDDNYVNRVIRWREERQRFKEAGQSGMRHKIDTEIPSHTNEVPIGAIPAPKPSKNPGVDEMARESHNARIPTEGPKTELRIRPRKRPGLLMLSEKTPTTISTSKRKPASTRNTPLDDSTSDALEGVNNNTRKSKRMASGDPESQGLDNRDKSGRNARNQRHETTGRDSIQIEDAVQIDDDRPEPSERRSPIQKPTRTRPKPRDRASKTSCRPSPNPEDEDVGALNDDLFEERDVVPPNKAYRRKRMKTVIEDEDDLQPEPSTLSETRNRRSKRNKKQDSTGANASFEEPDIGLDGTEDEEEVELPEEAPTPRLAKIKNGIRSRELIGFHFPDEDDEEDREGISASTVSRSDAPQHLQEDFGAQELGATSSVVVSQNSKAAEPPQTMIQQPSNHDHILQNLAKGTDPEESLEKDNEQSISCQKDQVAMDDSSGEAKGGQDVSLAEPQLPFDFTQNFEHLAETSLPAESGAQQAKSKDADSNGPQPPSVSSNLQRQDILVQNKPDLGGNVQQAAPEGTVAALQNTAATRKLINPATRGKRAAKPSDAAGQLPQCPLPQEARSIGLLRPLNAKKAAEAANQDKGAATPLPGFEKANGGPWSREAFDLFEFRRPT